MLWSTLAVAAVPAGLMAGAIGLERLEAHLLGPVEPSAEHADQTFPVSLHRAGMDAPTTPLPRLPVRPG